MDRMQRLVLVLSLLAAAAAPGRARAAITVKGSDSMVILAQRWAEAYVRERPGLRIQVTGGGSGTGFAALQNQQTDLCNASRRIRAGELEICIRAFGRPPTEYRVAMDGLAVYVHASNPIRALTVDQLGRIFTGRVQNWKEVGGPDLPITLYSRENSSGTYEFFKARVLRGRDFAASAETKPGTAAVLLAVGADPTAIGYGGGAYDLGNARHLAIKEHDLAPPVELSEETVVGGTYPIARPLYIYVNPRLDKGEVGHYIRWIWSDAGQKVVREVGYFPLPPEVERGP